MDLELTDEQGWLEESVDTLLTREWPGPEAVAKAGPERRRAVWRELVEFGACAIGDPDGIGAVEACLISRALGRHLAATPYLGSAALRLALRSPADDLPADFASLLAGEDAVTLAWLEPGGSWSPGDWHTEISDGRLSGEKVAVEHLDAAELVAVVAALAGDPALALVTTNDTGITATPRAGFDTTLPMSAATFTAVPVADDAQLIGETATRALERLGSAGALLASAEAIGAAGRVLEEACRYAVERRQFGRRIAGFQALRHLLADMHVRAASGWSSLLYAAAAFDDEAPDAVEASSVAKAYVSRAAREVAHGAMQVFGGIAFTDEHPAHRFLRRILVREQQFGDAAHHERALGRALARRATAVSL